MFGKRRPDRKSENAKLELRSLYMASLMATKGKVDIQTAIHQNDPEAFLSARQKKIAFYHFVDTNFPPANVNASTSLGTPDIPDALLPALLVIAEKWVEGKKVDSSHLGANGKKRFALIDEWMEDAFERLYRPVFDEYQAEKTRRVAWSEKVDLMALYPDESQLLEFLRQRGADPDLWHSIVIQTDPDGREDLYAWIASQPDCDKGTAIQIFHYSAGYEALGYPDETSFAASHRSTMYKTAKRVADRVAQDAFKTWRFAAIDVEAFGSLESHIERERLAAQTFGRPYFSVSRDLFDTTPRQEPETKFKYSDF